MLESFNTDKFEYKRLSSEEQEKRGILGRLFGKIADTKNPTRNGRKYSNQLWENVFDDPIMQEKIDNHLLLGELGHPEDREEIDISKAAICMSERPKKGKDGFLYGVFDILNTPNGKILKSLCDYGCNVAISSRGSGDVIYDDNGDEAVDPDTYVCETFDIVLVPGVEQARLQYVNEALDTKKRNKTLRQKLTEDIDKASAEDKKIMEETLKDLDINLDEEWQLKFTVKGIPVYIDNQGNFKATIKGKDIVVGDQEKIINIIKGENLDEEALEEDSVEYMGKEEMTGSSMYQADDGTFTASYQGKSFSADSLDELKQSLADAYEEMKKEINDLPEELEDEDGWGETIPDRLEDTFDDIERVIYEIRNARRGSYGIRGTEVSDLVAKLNSIADDLSVAADDFEYHEDELTEGMPKSINAQRALMGRLMRINQLSDEILAYDKEYDFNEEEDQLVIDNINATLDKIRDLAARLNIPVDEGCDHKEVSEDVGNTELVNQLQEALTNSAKLEKDNLSLQEKLSVCNAKEVKLEEEVAKYKKATTNLSESTKKVNSLKEELDLLKKDLKSKDKLIESKNNVIKSYKSRLSSAVKANKDKLDESVAKTTDLEAQVKKLTEQLEEKSKKLDKVTSIAKKYQSALKESKNSYIKAKAEAYGLDEESIRSQLKESYTLKDIDSVCEELSEYKRNMSKLPFRINENVKLNFKSSGDYIKGSDFYDDDNVSKTLLSFID